MNDTTFDALAHEQRRELLVGLLDGGPQTVEKTIAGDGETAHTDSGRRSRIAMYHTHLPKLEADGFVRWHQGAHEVVRGPRFEEIQPFVELVADREPGADRAETTGSAGRFDR